MKEFINCDLILNNLNSLNENLSEDEIFCIKQFGDGK